MGTGVRDYWMVPCGCSTGQLIKLKEDNFLEEKEYADALQIHTKQFPDEKCDCDDGMIPRLCKTQLHTNVKKYLGYYEQDHGHCSNDKCEGYTGIYDEPTKNGEGWVNAYPNR